MRCLILAAVAVLLAPATDAPAKPRAKRKPVETLNLKDDGYRGIWYYNQPSHDEYVYKYSGGLGTYCAKHRPFAIYRKEVDKTFFCYGGATKDDNRRLIHMVSFYDHKTGTVPRPTILLDKQTDDAHDNPVICMDTEGYVWIFSTAHGTSRPSFVHRSETPYSVDRFVRIEATKRQDGKATRMTNFSYMQPWYVPGRGFVCFFTRYNWPAQRTIAFMTSEDGKSYSEWLRLAAMEQGHYQISEQSGSRCGTAFNFHPKGKGVNWRTNLYYIETDDWGKTWHAADGTEVELPMTDPGDAKALVHDYRSEKLNVYLKDIAFDADHRPVLLYITSPGYESGPKNNPRTWTTARWTGRTWEIRPITTSDNNYDTGSIYLEGEGQWRMIGPTETGPQPFNPGGEIALWRTTDRGATWEKVRQMTANSERNHTYVRRPVDAHPGFYGFWADGHGRKPSISNLYFCTRDGEVYQLPRQMTRDAETPIPVRP